jgi:hypothetical protein
MDSKLSQAGYDLALDIRDGKWRHVEDLQVKPASASSELLNELRRRVPGHSDQQYAQALADGLFNSR